MKLFVFASVWAASIAANQYQLRAGAPGAAPAPAVAAPAGKLDTGLNDPMPLKAAEQGFEGLKVQHVNQSTMTADWGKEFGPDGPPPHPSQDWLHDGYGTEGRAGRAAAEADAAAAAQKAGCSGAACGGGKNGADGSDGSHSHSSTDGADGKNIHSERTMTDIDYLKELRERMLAAGMSTEMIDRLIREMQGYGKDGADSHTSGKDGADGSDTHSSRTLTDIERLQQMRERMIAAGMSTEYIDKLIAEMERAEWLKNNPGKPLPPHLAEGADGSGPSKKAPPPPSGGKGTPADLAKKSNSIRSMTSVAVLAVVAAAVVV